jgi:bifunctional DNA-binding transcriptional regulator/antitoxin component of YhaV-PrlF toxin-antitoxin module
MSIDWKVVEKYLEVNGQEMSLFQCIKKLNEEKDYNLTPNKIYKHYAMMTKTLPEFKKSKSPREPNPMFFVNVIEGKKNTITIPKEIADKLNLESEFICRLKGKKGSKEFDSFEVISKLEDEKRKERLKMSQKERQEKKRLQKTGNLGV